jgi:hypothetical protein
LLDQFAAATRRAAASPLNARFISSTPTSEMLRSISGFQPGLQGFDLRQRGRIFAVSPGVVSTIHRS